MRHGVLVIRMDVHTTALHSGARGHILAMRADAFCKRLRDSDLKVTSSPCGWTALRLHRETMD